MLCIQNLLEEVIRRRISHLAITFHLKIVRNIQPNFLHNYTGVRSWFLTGIGLHGLCRSKHAYMRMHLIAQVYARTFKNYHKPVLII